MSKPELTFSKLDEETGSLLDRMFDKKDSMLEINPGRVILPADYVTIGQDILDMEVRESDVWMCSHPRTGSTWALEMVWLIGHDLDYEGAKSLQSNRCPLVEQSCILGKHTNWHAELGNGTSVDRVKYRLTVPRYIRSHLPWHLLPHDIQRADGSVKPKMIYTLRNPKDIVVSYYHYFTLVYGLKGTFEEFCDIFMRDRTPFAPVWNHILGFWNRRHDPNLLFLKYTEMKHDLPSVIRRTATFLNKTISNEQVDKLCDHLSFKNMKTNRAVNMEPKLEASFGKSYLEGTNLRIIRKGEIGDWKNYMSDDLSRRFDEWADQNCRGTELSFE